MKIKNIVAISFSFVLLLLSACKIATTEAVDPPVLKSTTPEPTLANTPLPPPTSTPEPLQILGRIFQDGYESLGVSVNRNTGSINSQNTHFDIVVPLALFNNPSSCSVISPVKGIIKEIYQVGDPPGSSGSVIYIELSQPPLGIEEVLAEFNIDSTQVIGYGVHLGHLNNLDSSIQVGLHVERGTLLANSVYHDPEPRVAYVLYIMYGSGQLIQVSPCSVTNEASFCGVCYQYEGVCPETNMNFPEGGIQWWDEVDPFWGSHELSLIPGVSYDSRK